MCYSGSTHYFAEVLIPREMHAKYFPRFTDVLLGYVCPHTLVGGGTHVLTLRHHSSALCELRSKQCKPQFSTVPSKDEHPNPIDLNVNLSVRIEHPFSALCS